MKTALGMMRLHRAVQLAALGAVALVHEDEHLAHGLAGLGFQFLDERVEVVHALPAELVDQRAEQARLGLAELAHQVAAAAGARDGLAGLGEDALDLFVQLVAVGDDGHAGVGIVLQDPLGQQHHDDALAAALRVPDDAALVAACTCSCAALMPKYWCTRGSFFTPPSKSTKSCISSISRVLGAHLEQILVQLEAAVVRLVLLPLQEILLRRADGAVLQPLGVVAGEDELHGAEEPLVELRLLVGEVLADAVADGDAAVLQLQHADGDAVHIEHDVGPPLVVAAAA